MQFKKAVSGLIAVSAPLFATLSTQAAGFGKDADYVYVESNIKTANGNSIFAYRRAPNGQLSAIAGSPFLTGGSGIQFTGVLAGPPDSDQDIITNPDHSLLFAVNSGSDTIAVFRIKRDGSLEAVKGSPFASGGNNPVSLDLIGDTLFVVNKSDDPGRTLASLPNYTTLRVLMTVLSCRSMTRRTIRVGSSSPPFSLRREAHQPKCMRSLGRTCSSAPISPRA